MSKQQPERIVISDQAMTEQLIEHLGRIAAAHAQLKQWSTQTKIPHTVLPSVQSAARFLVISGDHINAALTLLKSEK